MSEEDFCEICGEQSEYLLDCCECGTSHCIDCECEYCEELREEEK